MVKSQRVTVDNSQGPCMWCSDNMTRLYSDYVPFSGLVKTVTDFRGQFLGHFSLIKTSTIQSAGIVTTEYMRVISNKLSAWALS